MVNTALTEFIRTRGRELGFVRIGIAPAEELVTEGKRLAEWLGRGLNGTMAWMERDTGRRTDPAAILPGAKSVVCFAMNYYHPQQHSADERSGKISRYAWGDDYHSVVGDRLADLLEEITTAFPGVKGIRYVDTGPVMEKAWAQRAGIGWIGKHTNVITEDAGSWVFLGEIILDAELEYDRPATDQCGSCTLCIEACPTGAITEAWILDARACISYRTIEFRGDFPESPQVPLDRWIYGCDVCQDVCPWNIRGAVESPLTEFAPRPHAIAPSLREMAELSEAEFQSRFRKSPVKRTKVAGIRRNALANLKHTNQ